MINDAILPRFDGEDLEFATYQQMGLSQWDNGNGASWASSSAASNFTAEVNQMFGTQTVPILWPPAHSSHQAPATIPNLLPTPQLRLFPQPSVQSAPNSIPIAPPVNLDDLPACPRPRPHPRPNTSVPATTEPVITTPGVPGEPTPPCPPLLPPPTLSDSPCPTQPVPAEALSAQTLEPARNTEPISPSGCDSPCPPPAHLEPVAATSVTGYLSGIDFSIPNPSSDSIVDNEDEDDITSTQTKRRKGRSGKKKSDATPTPKPSRSGKSTKGRKKASTAPSESESTPLPLRNAPQATESNGVSEEGSVPLGKRKRNAPERLNL